MEPVGDVSLTSVNRQDHPSLHEAERLVVIANSIVVQVLDAFLDEVNGLIFLNVVRLGSLEDVVLHLLQQFIIPVILRLLPKQFLRLVDADVFGFDLEQVEEALYEVFKLHHFAVNQRVEPLLVEVTLRQQVDVVLHLDLRHEQLLLLEAQLLALGLMLAIVVFFVWIDLGLHQRVLFLFLSNQEVLRDDFVILLLFFFVRGPVELKLHALKLFPVASESVNCFEDELSFIFCEDSVLPHGVKADDVLLVLGLYWRQHDLLPRSLFWYEFCACCLGIGLQCGLLSLMLRPFLFLLRLCVIVSVQVVACFLETVDVEAGLVDERYGHERPKTRHIPKVHFVFAHHLVDKDVLVLRDDLRVVRLAISALWNRNLRILRCEIIRKYVVCDALAWLEVSADDFGAMINIRENELDDLR